MPKWVHLPLILIKAQTRDADPGPLLIQGASWWTTTPPMLKASWQSGVLWLQSTPLQETLS